MAQLKQSVLEGGFESVDIGAVAANNHKKSHRIDNTSKVIHQWHIANIHDVRHRLIPLIKEVIKEHQQDCYALDNCRIRATHLCKKRDEQRS